MIRITITSSYRLIVTVRMKRRSRVRNADQSRWPCGRAAETMQSASIFLLPHECFHRALLAPFSAMAAPPPRYRSVWNRPFGEGGSFLSNQRSNLLGDMFGLRKSLSSYGINLAVETSEISVMSLAALKRCNTTVDTGDPAARHLTRVRPAWPVRYHHCRYTVRTQQQSRHTDSGSIEANRATRLRGTWYDQDCRDDRLDIRSDNKASIRIHGSNSGVLRQHDVRLAGLPSYDSRWRSAYPLSVRRALSLSPDRLVNLPSAYSTDRAQIPGDAQHKCIRHQLSAGRRPLDHGRVAVRISTLGSMVYR